MGHVHKKNSEIPSRRCFCSQQCRFANVMVLFRLQSNQQLQVKIRLYVAAYKEPPKGGGVKI